MTNEEIIQRGQLINDETEPAQNTSERVGGVIKGIGQNLADKDTAIAAEAARNGYYQCTVSGTTLAVTAPGFTLPAHGGNIRIKMSAPATGDCTLNINGTGAKQLLYNGAAVSSVNTWEQNEIISVFYDPSGSGQYLASNSQGGGGKAEKIKYDNSQSRLNATDVQGAVDEVSGELTIAQNKTISYTQASGRLNLPNGATAYVVPSNDMVTRYIPVVAGNTYQVSGSYSGAIYARIGFATSVPASGVSARVIFEVTFQGGFTKTYKPTSNGYLSISHYNQSGMNAAVFKLIGTPLKGAVKELSDEADDLDGQINDKSISQTTVNNLNQSGGSTYVSGNGYQTRYIPVKAGYTYLATFFANANIYVRFCKSSAVPANGVSSDFLTQLYAQNSTVSYEYTADADGYFSLSFYNDTHNTYSSTFTRLAGKPELGTSKAEFVPIGNSVIQIRTINSRAVVIPRNSYVIYKDKVLRLSDKYNSDISLSLSTLEGVLRVSFNAVAQVFSVKQNTSDLSSSEFELFSFDTTTGKVTLQDNFYRFNGVIGAGRERKTYLANNKIEINGKKLYGYDAVNFGYPVLDGANYIDGGGSGHALGDIAIYGDELFAFYQNGYVNVYNISDINNVTLSGSFRLQTDIHCNAAQFAPTVLEGETYPLIYVANGIQDGGGDFTTVEQIRKVNGVYESTLVQKITVTSTPDYKINTIIGDDGYFWAIGNKGATNNVFYYAKFALPDISNPTVTLNYNSNSIEKWTESKSYSIAPYVQGLCICQGKAFHVLGNGDGVSETLNEIHVVDLNTRTPLTDIILTDFDYTKIQGCDVYKGCLIVSRNFGKGFTMLVM